MGQSDELLKELDQIAEALTHNGSVKSVTVFTPGGYFIEITEEKYRQILAEGKNPITVITTATATATATAHLSIPEGIRDILCRFETSGADAEELAAAVVRQEVLSKFRN